MCENIHNCRGALDWAGWLKWKINSANDLSIILASTWFTTLSLVFHRRDPHGKMIRQSRSNEKQTNVPWTIRMKKKRSAFFYEQRSDKDKSLYLLKQLWLLHADCVERCRIRVCLIIKFHRRANTSVALPCHEADRFPLLLSFALISEKRNARAFKV